MKTCKRCEVEKSLDAYSTNGKCGLHPVCKACAAEKARLKRVVNGDHVRALEAQKYLRNRAAMREANRKYCEANKIKRSEIEKARYAANTEEMKIAAKQYRAANPDKVRAWNGTRRATQRRATPPWANLSLIKEIYAKAGALWRDTGEVHHVDHIIPLAHPRVCGLHVQANLQVLLGVENMRKSNSFHEAEY